MGEVTTLFTQYSVEELVLLIIIVLFVLRALNEVISYFYNKIKEHFGIENQKEERDREISESLLNMQAELGVLKEQNEKIHAKQKAIESTIALVQERLQENTRSYLIDAHHKFCYEIKAIDDLSLQAMERRYLYYKTAQGNSFVDGLMDQVRQLPRINFYTGVVDENHDKVDDREEHAHG